ncbi:hypothetical protein GRS48_13190 [Halorubrum sp. JWXQ-INN 858]|uniref:hypothetical protein n=1 Tax=Halorubrum sp. JWXQ-INN 858 TaxID=2690782 RepID=UPI00135748DB|nr:hypothetical protein [Halorubrum sp. JWXQ-INN 858]MWV65767.1 hypothetical protein [Halorubrum sp. JWXQ-INN 858]
MTRSIALSNRSVFVIPRRRGIVAAVADGVATVADLRHRGRPEEIDEDLRENHLPALAEAGIIEWDPETGEVSPGPNFEEALARLDSFPSAAVAADD